MSSDRERSNVGPVHRSAKCGALSFALLLCLAPAGLRAQAVTAVPAQGRATNDVARCTLLVDPTAQRACIEGTLQSRPAAAFDPTVQKPRAGRMQATLRSAKAMTPVTVDAGPVVGQASQAELDAVRQRYWRLQIP